MQVIYLFIYSLSFYLEQHVAPELRRRCARLQRAADARVERPSGGFKKLGRRRHLRTVPGPSVRAAAGGKTGLSLSGVLGAARQEDGQRMENPPTSIWEGEKKSLWWENSAYIVLLASPQSGIILQELVHVIA